MVTSTRLGYNSIDTLNINKGGFYEKYRLERSNRFLV